MSVRRRWRVVAVPQTLRGPHAIVVPSPRPLGWTMRPPAVVQSRGPGRLRHGGAGPDGAPSGERDDARVPGRVTGLGHG
jgi:hypothetical protein